MTYLPSMIIGTWLLSSANGSRFAESRGVLARVLASKSLDGAPVLLMANKQDPTEAQSPHDVAENLSFEVHGRGDGRPTKIVPACAFTGEGLKEGLEWLVAMIKSSPRTTSIRLRNVKH